MSGGDLIALAERCERATGADIQLDADIRDALSLPSDYSAEWRGWGFDEAGDPIEKPKAFPYTAALRARATFPAASQPVPKAEAQHPTRVEAVAGDTGDQQ